MPKTVLNERFAPGEQDLVLQTLKQQIPSYGEFSALNKPSYVTTCVVRLSQMIIRAGIVLKIRSISDNYITVTIEHCPS